MNECGIMAWRRRSDNLAHPNGQHRHAGKLQINFCGDFEISLP